MAVALAPIAARADRTERDWGGASEGLSPKEKEPRSAERGSVRDVHTAGCQARRQATDDKLTRNDHNVAASLDRRTSVQAARSWG